MGFQFDIHSVSKARRPIVLLHGEVMDGELGLGERVSVPLTDGHRVAGDVVGILKSWEEGYRRVAVGEPAGTVFLAVRLPSSREMDEVVAGVATGRKH
jgi:hypothetical protein